jgi:hypothetical protein
MRIRLAFAAGAVGVLLLLTLPGIAVGDDSGMATGSVSYQGWAGTETLTLAAWGTPSAAQGWMQFRRVAEGFDANSGGPVECFLQVGNGAYFSGTFTRTFLSGPTEVRYFNGIVVDSDQTGEPDSAFVMLGADAPIPCDDAGTMAFLDSVSFPVVGGNIIVH